MYRLMRFFDGSGCFDEVCSGDDLENVLDATDGERGNFHIRVDDDDQQWIRGGTPVCRYGIKHIKMKYPHLDDLSALKIISVAYYLNDDYSLGMSIEEKIDIVIERQS